jgi:hypothetical protein
VPRRVGTTLGETACTFDHISRKPAKLFCICNLWSLVFRVKMLPKRQKSAIPVVFSETFDIPLGKSGKQGKVRMQYPKNWRESAKTCLHAVNAWSSLVRREAEMRFGEPAVRGAVDAAGRSREEFMVRLTAMPRRYVVSLYSRLGERARSLEAGGGSGNGVISDIRWAQSQARERLWMTDS